MAKKNLAEKINCRIMALIYVCTATLFLTATANGANITAFGDSITAGNGSDTGGYPPRLQALLSSNNKPSIVANYGNSGEQTPQGINRFDAVLAAFPTNIILIMEGTNDVRSGISVETTKYNLQAMISKAKAASVIPFLSTLTPSDRGDSGTLIPTTWNPMIVTLASSNGIVLVDQFAAVSPSWGSLNDDGIHPNDSGYQVLANTWYAALAPMISSSGEVGSSGGGGGGSSCFIATAAFGSPAEKHVMLLKEFRNTCLLTNGPGRQFVKAYYRLSPPIAEFIGKHDGARYAARLLLYPLVVLSYLLLKLSFPLQLFLIALVTGTVTLSVIFFKRNQGDIATAETPI